MLGLKGFEINLSVLSIRDKFGDQGLCAKGVGWTQFWIGLRANLGWTKMRSLVLCLIQFVTRIDFLNEIFL